MSTTWALSVWPAVYGMYRGNITVDDNVGRFGNLHKHWKFYLFIKMIFRKLNTKEKKSGGRIPNLIF
jgi:hypothetical protein